MKTTLNPLNAMSYGIDDYIKMFALTQNELEMNIVNCYAGVNAFASDMMNKQSRVVACDPLYHKSQNDILAFTVKAQSELIADIERHPERFILNASQIKEFINNHQKNLDRFIKDFPIGLKENRYTKDVFPHFSFQDEQFDLALVSHYFFSQDEQFSLELHLKAIQELMRIANEVRIFPLLTYEGDLSPYVGEVVSRLQLEGIGVEIKGVPFEFQKHANAIMRIFSDSCSVGLHAKRN